MSVMSPFWPRSGGEDGHLIWTTKPPLLDSRVVIFASDVVLAGLIILIILWRSPRAVARFARSSAWRSGHFFTYKQIAPPKDSDAVEKPSNPASTVQHQPSQPPTYPPHVLSTPRPLRPLSLLLQVRFVPGFTVGQCILVSGYVAYLIVTSLYKSNPFTDALREGWILMAQLPFLVAFATKNNLIGWLMGFGYEKLNFFHRWMARMIVLWANIHTLGYVYHWALEGTFLEHTTRIDVVWGWVVLAALNIIFFFSLRFWRTRVYGLFLSTHVLAITIFLPGIWYHNPHMMPYVVSALILFGVDRVVRLVKSRITKAFLYPIPELNCTRVVIPKVNGGWRAGQHVRLRVLSTCMGPMGWIEIHPFTIASVAETPEGMVLMCKNIGSWTRNLYLAALRGTDGENGSPAAPRTVNVHVEGPYGGTGHTIIPSFSGALIVAGGSGVTFALSTVQDILKKDLEGQCRIKNVDVVWIVQDPMSLNPLIPTFSEMLSQAQTTHLRISVFYTRPLPLDQKLAFNPEDLPKGFTLLPSRPKLCSILDNTVSETMSMSGGPKDAEGLKGVIVACCGPVSLGDDCATAVAQVGIARMREVGGVELHEEVFGW